jgi:hypothetical protein
MDQRWDAKFATHHQKLVNTLLVVASLYILSFAHRNEDAKKLQAKNHETFGGSTKVP